MQIFRPVPGSPNVYTVIAHDGPRGLSSGVLNTFPTRIPVRAGDFIGLNDANAKEAPNACFFQTLTVTDVLGIVETDTPDGSSVTVPPLGLGGRPNVVATLQPAPTVTAISPPSGTFLGGTSVTITGTDFEGTAAVSFGGAPAAGYSVDNEGQITAISPPSSAGATVDVSVITLAGTSAAVAADKFTYSARPVHGSRCTVPKLQGKTLRAARRRVKRAHCKLGKIKGATGAAARVKKQRPRVGSVLASGAKVSITLSTAHRHRAGRGQ